MTEDESFISQEIQNLLCDRNNTRMLLNIYESKYLNSDFTLNWENISKEILKTTNYKNYNLVLEFCKIIVKILKPIWFECHSVILNNLNNNLLQICLREFYSILPVTCCCCARDKDDLINCLNFNSDSSEITTPIQNILYLTSLLENSLGNIYFIISKRAPPHLLRDLINTNELLEIFGYFPIFHLNIILGTPNSINLRNIVWHGFPTVDEVPSYYVTILILIIISFAKIWNKEKSKNYHLLSEQDFVNHHHKIIDFKNAFYKMKFTQFENGYELLESKENQMNLIDQSKFISAKHKIFWYNILNNYYTNNYMTSIRLLLPQFELLLRRIYGTLNNVDIQAKINEYYIIMDTTVAEYIKTDTTNEINKIYKIFNLKGALKYIYDGFTSMLGPRIRDKFSHGEVCKNDINKDINCKLLLLSFNIIAVMNDDNNNDNKIMEYKQLYNNYESIYHLNGCLKISLEQVYRKLIGLRLIPIPEELQNICIWNNNNADENKNEFDFIRTTEIFYRSIRESELISCLLKILNNIDKSCDNFNETISKRINQYMEKLLRSKRRQTLIQQLKYLPNIWIGLWSVFKLTNLMFTKLQQIPDYLTDERFEKLKRLLKQIQKYTENICTYSEIKTNNWMDSLKKTADILKLINIKRKSKIYGKRKAK